MCCFISSCRISQCPTKLGLTQLTLFVKPSLLVIAICHLMIPFTLTRALKSENPAAYGSLCLRHHEATGSNKGRGRKLTIKFDFASEIEIFASG